MSAADLNLSTVELTSTLITAPLNGAPSSADYNDSQRANLVDLSTIVSFINNQVLPLINALPEGALLPSQSPVGIQGATIWTNTTDQGQLFFDSLSSVPLTIYESFNILNGILTTNSQQLIDLGVEVASLQSLLASTNQNEISLALQNLSSSLSQLTVTQNVSNTAISSLQTEINALNTNLSVEISRAEAAEGLLLANVLTTTGDLIYADPNSTPARLPIGTTGYVLTVVGGLPAWAAPTGGGGGGGGGTPGGITGQVQLNVSSAFAGQDAGGGYISIGSDVTDGILLIDDSAQNGIEIGVSVGGVKIGSNNSTKVVGSGASINLGFLGDSTFSLQSGLEIVIQTEDGNALTIDAGTCVFGSETAVTIQDTFELEGKLFDVHGLPGTSGQILSSTGTTTQWITPVSGGSPVGANVVQFPKMTGTAGGFNGYSIVLSIPAGCITAFTANGCRVGVRTTTVTGLVLNHASIGATLPGSTVWITTPTTFTFPAGAFTAANTTYYSNATGVAMDTAHDWYIVLYWDPTSVNGSGYITGNTITSDILHGGYISGDHSNDADASAFGSLGGNLTCITSVITA